LRGHVGWTTLNRELKEMITRTCAVYGVDPRYAIRRFRPRNAHITSRIASNPRLLEGESFNKDWHEQAIRNWLSSPDCDVISEVIDQTCAFRIMDHYCNPCNSHKCNVCRVE